MEKIKEEKLISDIESLNKSFKHKNPENFLNALNEICLENFEGILQQNTLTANNSSLLNSPDKSRRCFSYDRLDTAEIELNLNTFKTKGNYNSPNSTSNKFCSQSTDYMSDNCSRSTMIDSVDSKLQSLNNFNRNNESDISAFLVANKKTNISNNNPLSNLPSANDAKYNLENFISQNLIISDEVIKIITVGDRGVGKSLFVNKFCENIDVNSNYEPTQWYIYCILFFSLN